MSSRGVSKRKQITGRRLLRVEEVAHADTIPPLALGGDNDDVELVFPKLAHVKDRREAIRSVCRPEDILEGDNVRLDGAGLHNGPCVPRRLLSGPLEQDVLDRGSLADVAPSVPGRAARFRVT